MKEINIFKLFYQWYEDDSGETFLGKEVAEEDFEKDLLEAKDFAESLKGIEIKDGDYLGKGYSVECLPEYYQQIIWFLTEKKGYLICNIAKDVEYFVDDDSQNKLAIKKYVHKIERQEIPIKNLKTQA